MTRLLIFGSSQAGTLYLAKDVLAAQEGLQTDWLVAPANLPFDIDPETGQLRPETAYMRTRRSRSMQIVGGRPEGIFVRDYDVILYASVGLRPPRAIDTHPVHALARMPVSDALVTTMMQHHENLVVHHRNLTGLRQAGFAGQLLCERWLRPDRLPEGAGSDAWERSCAAEDLRVEAIARDVSARLLPWLPGMERLTDTALLDRPELAGVHGNATYARTIIDRVLTLLEPVPA